MCVIFLTFGLVHIKFSINALFIIIIVHLILVLLIFCMYQSFFYQRTDSSSLYFSLQMAGQRDFSVQFLKWRSHANGGWGSILRSRAVICLMAASALTHMDLSRRICINATVLSESFLLWWQRGAIFHCPLPSDSFTAFSCLLLCLTSTLAYTEALKTGQCLTSREQCLIEIGDDFISRMVLNGRFASGQLCPDPCLSSYLVSSKTNSLPFSVSNRPT